MTNLKLQRTLNSTSNVQQCVGFTDIEQDKSNDIYLVQYEFISFGSTLKI